MHTSAKCLYVYAYVFAYMRVFVKNSTVTVLITEDKHMTSHKQENTEMK